MGNTIAAVATPPGEGGIATVRISGDNAIEVADRVFCSASGKRLCEIKGYTALFGHVVYNGETVDESVALLFRAPKSYTGEDVVELSVHGGDYVVQKVLRAVLDAGAVIAERGEFTRRAFLNGKMDLSQAEAVMSIISADGEQSLRAGLEAHDGAVSRKCNDIKDKLTFAAATVAAFSDFPDEEPEFSGIDKLENMLMESKKALNELIDSYDVGHMIKNGINTVIVGPPNAGKSTLMNLLAGFDRSIVTPVAGTTRDAVEETVRLGDITLRLWDTAGLRKTDDAVEKIGIDRTRRRIESADLIIAVFDGSETLNAEDGALLDSLKGRHAIVVFNKTDISEPSADPAITRGLPFVFMSARDGNGAETLAKEVKRVTGTAGLSGTAAVYLNERQRSCAVKAAECVCDALSALSSGFTVDAVGVCLDDALASLMELTGERVTVEVANEVFKHFCVGK